jgi:hypothetical protein
VATAVTTTRPVKLQVQTGVIIGETSTATGENIWDGVEVDASFDLVAAGEDVILSEVGQPVQCKWRPLIGQCEITAYIMSAGSSLPSFLHSRSFRSCSPS